MHRELMTRERKYILAAGGLLLLLGVIYRFYPGTGGNFPSGESLYVKMKTVKKYEAKLEERPELQKRVLDLTRQAERTQDMLLEGATPAIAAVEIQNVFSEIVKNTGLSVTSILVRKPRESAEKGYLEVSVQAVMTLDVQQLRDLLYKIETTPKLLTVTDLRLRRMEKQGPDTLSATFTVAGYMKKPPEAKPKKK